MQVRELLALARRERRADAKNRERRLARNLEHKVLLTFKGDPLAYGGICCGVGPKTKKVDALLMQEILHDLNKRKLASANLEIAQPGDEDAFLVKWKASEE